MPPRSSEQFHPGIRLIYMSKLGLFRPRPLAKTFCLVLFGSRLRFPQPTIPQNTPCLRNRTQNSWGGPSPPAIWARASMPNLHTGQPLSPGGSAGGCSFVRTSHLWLQEGHTICLLDSCLSTRVTRFLRARTQPKGFWGCPRQLGPPQVCSLLLLPTGLSNALPTPPPVKLMWHLETLTQCAPYNG